MELNVEYIYMSNANSPITVEMFLLYAQHLHYVLHILFKGGTSANMSLYTTNDMKSTNTYSVVILTCGKQTQSTQVLFPGNLKI